MKKYTIILLLLPILAYAAKNESILKKNRVLPHYKNITVLKEIALNNSSAQKRNRALYLLDKMRSVHTLQALSEILKKTKDGQLRDRAAMALTRLPNHKGYRTLEYGTSLSSSPVPVRISCLKALAATLNKGITHMVNLLLRDSRYRIRFAAARALPQAATKYNVYHMNRILKTGSTVAIKRAVALGMIALNSRRTRAAAIAAICREKDPVLLGLLLKHLLKSGGCSANILKKWSSDSSKPAVFRKNCAAAVK